MRLLLDTSVILAACGSSTGASADVIRWAEPNAWSLLMTPYIAGEVEANLPDLPPIALREWVRVRTLIEIVEDVLTLDRPVVFEPAKDRPVLFSALAWADVLLTLDRADFGPLFGGRFYGLDITSPGAFLIRQRAAGELRF